MPNDDISYDSAFLRRRRLHEMIGEGRLDNEVLRELVPEGQPHAYEKQLWDYKMTLPLLASGAHSEEMKAAHNAKIAELIKDAVSFYNSYGGYILAGVSDAPRSLNGFDGTFNCDDFNKRIRGVTQHDLDCHIAYLHWPDADKQVRLALLFVPQRPDTLAPAQFLRDAPAAENGKRAYKKHDIYFRQGDECRPTTTAEDLSFLCSQGRRHFAKAPANLKSLPRVVDNNLGPRDPGFIRFIGRDDYLTNLWQWLCDPFRPGLLLAGLGGVGKTTLAREFVEDIVRNSPMGFECVVWLTAKQQFYTAVLGRYVPASRVDFTDARSLLRALLAELGCPESQIDPEAEVEELAAAIVSSLKLVPSFVVVDDVDSLEPAQQQTVFHLLLQIMGQTSGAKPSRVLLTARLDLGAAPSQLIRVKGLDSKDFADYVEMTAKSMDLPWQMGPNSKQMQRFRAVTEGSPTFAGSILRLVQLGETLPNALERWKGSDGEEVREFAFERELAKLSESQARTLYALCLLGDTTLVELQHIIDSSRSLLHDDIGELRKYHLLVIGSDIPGAGVRLIVAGGVRLMSSVLKTRVHDPKRIEAECVKARAGTPKLGQDIGRVIHEVVALWRADLFPDALELAQWADGSNPGNANVKCLLGRAFLLVEPPRAHEADVAFKEAHDLGCGRPELWNLWIGARRLRGDWRGVIEITRMSDDQGATAESAHERARAFADLAEMVRSAGNMRKAAEYYHEGAKDIDELFKKNVARGRVPELKEFRSTFMRNYVWLIHSLTPDPEEQVDTWMATVEAFNCYVRTTVVIKFGLERLSTWWTAVENRRHNNTKSANLMSVQLTTLSRMKDAIKAQVEPDKDLINYMSAKEVEFEGRLNAYVDAIGKGATT